MLDRRLIEWKRQLTLLNTLWMYRIAPKESLVSDDDALQCCDELIELLTALADEISSIVDS